MDATVEAERALLDNSTLLLCSSLGMVWPGTHRLGVRLPKRRRPG
jgi:hypothetical protein